MLSEAIGGLLLLMTFNNLYLTLVKLIGYFGAPEPEGTRIPSLETKGVLGDQMQKLGRSPKRTMHRFFEIVWSFSAPMIPSSNMSSADSKGYRVSAHLH
jgi:hypothetical protein